MRTHSLISGASLACALALCGGVAVAAPVVLGGSSYSLALTQASTPNGFAAQTLTFDGVAETFVHRDDGPVSVTVQESQTDLGGGRYAIDIALTFAGGDPFPSTSQSPGVGIGWLGAATPLDGLDTARDVALTAFSVSARAGDDTALFIDLFPDLGWLATTPWNGVSAGGFVSGVPWAQRGLRQMTVHFETLDVQAVNSPGTLPLLGMGLGLLALRRARELRWRHVVAAMPLLPVMLTAAPAHAGPVVQQGSSYGLALFQQFGPGVYRTTVTFDGVDETFVYTPLGGTQVSLTVRESQQDLGAGRAAIDVSLGFAGGDPFPDASSVSGFGLGVGTRGVAGDALDLTSLVELTAARVQGVASDGSLLSYDLLPEYQRLGFGSPWDGALISRGGSNSIAWFVDTPWANLGLRELRLHFETQSLNSVPSPGTLPLLGLGLFALGWRHTRR